MTQIRKVFITVKTYPTISKKYDELVCTAGILDDGSWVRIYPLPFRKLDYEKRYKKYQWIELPLKRNYSDVRPESYQIENLSKISLVDEPVGTGNCWHKRKQIIFSKNQIYNDLSQLINKAHENHLSLAIFKPAQLIAFDVESTDREWSKEKLRILEQKAKQLSLFQTAEEVKKEFMVVDKLPYKFYYRFLDSQKKESRLMIEDWEIGALYFNCLKNSNGVEEIALSKVREKYWDKFSKTDLHFFLGTTKQFHGWAKNPFVIIGVFPPPKQKQLSLF
ncbi:MAG: hypothetical protein P4L42_01270 [Desulfocapsaceae bacterium]|nr:hypothetical protein [Desulfocapsaceae bacterium]